MNKFFVISKSWEDHQRITIFDSGKTIDDIVVHDNDIGGAIAVLISLGYERRS